jgi:hypothetical protein
MAEKLQDLNKGLKSKMRDAIKKQKSKLKCSECGWSLGSWTVGGLGIGKSIKCKNKDCGHTLQIDMTDIKKILADIENL